MSLRLRKQVVGTTVPRVLSAWPFFFIFLRDLVVYIDNLGDLKIQIESLVTNVTKKDDITLAGNISQ